MKCNLSDTEFARLSEVIASASGLHFPPERYVMLGRCLSGAAAALGFQSFKTFTDWLLTASMDKQQLGVLARYLTISETYFWREPQVFSALMANIIPSLTESKKNVKKRLQIWSAGCSSGEEPYSIAMALHRTIPDIKDWQISILATDINPKAIEKAEKAVYSSWSFRNTPEWLKHGYFNPCGKGLYQVSPGIRDMVSFKCLSLAGNDPLPLQGGKADIIFCRNVLMYFTPEWVSRITQKFFDTLSDEGWFVVSSCELSSQLFPQFALVNFPGAVCYIKGTPNPSFAGLPLNNLTADVFSPAINPVPAAGVEDALNAFFSQFEKNTGNALEIPPSPLPSAKAPVHEAVAEPVFSGGPAIRQLADKGQLDRALEMCNAAIAMDKLCTGLYYLRASILQETGKPLEAVSSLKQAVYIDPDFIMGHFTLGNLFISQGKPSVALRYFKNVQEIISKFSDDEIIPESEGLSVRNIREIIRANLRKQSV